MATPTETQEQAPEQAPTTPETPTPEGQPAPTGTATPSADADKKRPTFSLNTSPELRTALEAKAKAEDVPLAGLIRKASYAYLGIEMPTEELTAGTKRKYANEDERKQATNARNEELKQLLELSKLARAKGLNLTDLLKQQIQEGAAAGNEPGEANSNGDGTSAQNAA